MIEQIKNNRITAVIKSDSYRDSLAFSNACIEGGIKNIEIITTSPGAKRLLRNLSRIEDICLGAGTVLDRSVAEEAVEHGANFIVCPHTDPDIINFCVINGIPVFAGAFTSSEIVNAWKLGVSMVKIFPSSVVGPKYIRAVKEPLPFIEIFVTGGINLDNVNDYLSSGASCVGISSSLLGPGGSFDFDEILQNSRKFTEKIRQVNP